MQLIVLLAVVFLIIWAQAAIYKRYWRHGLSLDISFSSPAAYEGDRLFLIETISNAKMLPLPWVNVKFQLSRELKFDADGDSKSTDDYYRNDLFLIFMFQRVRRELPFRCNKRGYYTVKSADLLSGDILVSKKFACHIGFGASLHVFPGRIDLLDTEIPFRRLSGSITAQRMIDPDPFEFRAIREYMPADPQKNVNFKASAKTGQLMVNVFNPTVTQEIVVFLNLQPYTSWPLEELYEQAVRLCGAMAAAYLDEGIPVSFITNGIDCVTKERIGNISGASGGQTSILEALARIDLKRVSGDFAADIVNYAENAPSEPVYLLISTYCGEDIQDAFGMLKQKGFDAMWIIPDSRVKRTKEPDCGHLLNDDIIRWECCE